MLSIARNKLENIEKYFADLIQTITKMLTTGFRIREDVQTREEHKEKTYEICFL